MESVVEEVFELERFHPLRGWVFLREADRAGNAISEQDKEFHPNIHLNPGWIWTHVWMIDANFMMCDEEGWCYASTISRLNAHLAQGLSKLKKEPHHFVRRRRWIRTRVLTFNLQPRRLTQGDSAAEQRRLNTMDSSSIVESTEEREQKPQKRFLRQDSSISHILHGRSADRSVFLHPEVNTADVAKEGWLGKRGSFSRNWKLRYFILRRDVNALVYLNDRTTNVQLGEVPINGHTSVVSDPTPNTQQYNFVIVNGDRQFRLNAADAASRADWINAISEMIVQCRASFLEFGNDEDSSTPSKPDSISRCECDEDGCLNCHKPAWRPYSLICSTLHRKLPNVDLYYRNLHNDRITEYLELVRVTTLCVIGDIDRLDESIHETVARTSTQLTEPMLRELRLLREKVLKMREQFCRRLEAMRSNQEQCILVSNRFKRELYVQAKHWVDALIVHAQITLKPVQRRSPKGRIPTQWFEEGDDISVASEAQSAAPVEVEKRSESLHLPENRRRHSSIATGTTGMEILDRLARKIDSGKPRNFARPYFIGESFVNGESFGFELPHKLLEGHPELPPGTNDLVVFVRFQDIGSILGFTLCSKAYAEELQSQYPSLDIFLGLRQEMENPNISLQRRRRAFPEHMAILRSSIPKHIDLDYSFESKTQKHYVRCVIFYAAQFHALRHAIYPGNLGFLESLANCNIWETSGGKSGASFSMTHDKRLIIKEIPFSEFNMFVHMAPSYFDYMAKILTEVLPSVLGKILGLYKVTRHESGERTSKKVAYVIVMENIMAGCSGTSDIQMYDLKGLVRRRFVDDTGSKTNGRKVLQDGNFMERIPVPVFQKDLQIFMQAVDNDTEFLCKVGVIDYSLLIAIDEENRQLIAGIIDHIHQYDFLKKMESTSKASITFHNPTIISPVPYRKRFNDAMQRYFVAVDAPAGEKVSNALTARQFLPSCRVGSAISASDSCVSDTFASERDNRSLDVINKRADEAQDQHTDPAPQ